MVSAFEFVNLGTVSLANRIVMAPLTRVRAETDGTPTELMARYYGQRASAGLIISEACAVSGTGRPFLTSPGMYTHEHAVAWREVVRTVHQEEGRIFLQIYHCGRVNNLQHLPRPVPPLAPSAIPVSPHSRDITINIPRVTPYITPREIPADEIPLIVGDFRRATEMASWAGFDGVELHADSGYLIHQFFSTNANRRTDQYGGSMENRSRFAFEVLDAVAAVNGHKFIGIKLTPRSPVQDIVEDDADDLYPYVIDELNRRPSLAFLHLYFRSFLDDPLFLTLARRYAGTVIGEGSRTLTEYQPLLEDGTFELVAFGRAFISNPDLPDRLEHGLPLSSPDAATTYSQGPEGYVDYSAWDASDPEGSVVGAGEQLTTISGTSVAGLRP